MVYTYLTIQELKTRRDQLNKKIKDCKDAFFIYGYVNELEEVEQKIQELCKEINK